jgi:hypothetical protein
MNPLIIGASQRTQLNALRDFAAGHPVDMTRAQAACRSPEGLRQHLNTMDILTIELPVAYRVTFSIDLGHPVGPCRHMSLSSRRRDKSPVPAAVWMVCEELGFVGTEPFEGCTVWTEKLVPQGREDKGQAINVLQPVAMVAVSPYASLPA